MERLLCILCFVFSVSAIKAENRALLIGIGHYASGTEWSPIHGDADVELLRPMLVKRGFSDIRTLINHEATKQAIVAELKSLIKRCQSGDKVYFHFSGHGQPIEDINEDEMGEFDESIIPYNASKYACRGKYEGQNHLIDDEYNLLLNAIKKKLGKDGQLFIAIDACYSKGMERGTNDDIDNFDIVGPSRGTDEPFAVAGHSSYLKRVPKPKRFDVGANLVIVSACLQTERNYEYKTYSGKIYGSLSFYIYTLLKTNADYDSWIRCFKSEEYRNHRIFQHSQHPTITLYD